MKGCHFSHKRVLRCYEAEALKDNVWYGLCYSPDEGIYYWERCDGHGEFVSQDFTSVKAAREWMWNIEQVPVSEK